MPNPALKLDVLIAHPSYGGNGGISSEHPNIREWAVETTAKMKADERIGKVHVVTVGDTPITMVRNQFVRQARELGAHLLLMIDSDQNPMMYKDDPTQEPFWDVAFDEIYNHYGKGPLVIGAPYCGSPPHENIFVFQFGNTMDLGDETPMSLDQYTRSQAATMSGIQECAALPTGMILYDMRAFELIEPTKLTREEIMDEFQAGTMSRHDALRNLQDGWFYYEWKDGTASEKASTEDVTNTRDIALAGVQALGYNPVRCAWSSWVGHWKPWCVGKPRPYTVEMVSDSFKRTVERGQSCLDETIQSGMSDVQALLTKQNRFPEEAGNNGHVDIPDEVRDLIPASLHHEVKMRDVFGCEMATLFHVTSGEHLVSLRELVFDTWKSVKRNPIRILEVGSWLGESAAAMASAPVRNEIICVDNWSGPMVDPNFDVIKVLQYNIRNHPNISILPGNSVDVAAECLQQLKAATFEKQDIIFIDAGHTYEEVRADVLAWLPLLASDGVFIGHDYHTKQFPGVNKAVGELFGTAVEPYGMDGKTGGFWLVHAEDIDVLSVLAEASAT
jgi:cephalosporin hydroxylase